MHGDLGLESRGGNDELGVPFRFGDDKAVAVDRDLRRRGREAGFLRDVPVNALRADGRHDQSAAVADRGQLELGGKDFQRGELCVLGPAACGSRCGVKRRHDNEGGPVTRRSEKVSAFS